MDTNDFYFARGVSSVLALQEVAGRTATADHHLQRKLGAGAACALMARVARAA
jgi:hypothetical protein